MKRKMLTLFSSILMLTLLLSGLPTKSYACSCVPKRPVQEEYEAKTAVFSGKVVDIEYKRGPFKSSADPVKVTFEVYETWKGPKNAHITIQTALHEESCGFEFEQNAKYIVYAHGEDGKLETGYCTRTNELAGAAEDLAILKAEYVSYKPKNEAVESETGTRTVLFIVVIAVSVIIAVAALYLLTRRSKN